MSQKRAFLERSWGVSLRNDLRQFHCPETRSTINVPKLRRHQQAALEMMRASDVNEFARALAGWRFPSANVVFGDTRGNIGYWVVGALPIRSSHAVQGGRFPHDGTQSKYNWQGMIPHDLKPHLVNPPRAYIFSANHRPVGSFYKLYIGNNTGSMGETLRSWRLRELLSGKNRYSPDDVLAVHYDSVNPARRDIVRIGFHLRDVLQHDLSREANKALAYLEGWDKAGSPSDLTVPGADLAAEINTLFRMMSTELAIRHGGGETGLAIFLKRVRNRLTRDPQAAMKQEEREFIDGVLKRAWNSALNKYGTDPVKWQQRAREAVVRRKLSYYQSLDGFPSLDAEQDLSMPNLNCVDGATIRSQASQAYTQFVPMHDVDQAKSLLPIGISERPSSPSRTTTLRLWESGELHPAPLSRKAIEPHVRSRTPLTLSPPLTDINRQR